MRRLITVATIAALSGCAAPPSIGEAVPTPNDRLLGLQSENQGKGASITVIREGAAQAGHCFFGVYVDGKLVARLDNNEKASFHVMPGRRLVGVGADPQGSGPCSGNSSYRREVATWIQAGEKHTFRIAFQPMLDIRPSSY